MANPLTLAISNLPVADQIQDGNKLIISDGITTQQLDFADFVVGLDNTTFAATISANTANIAALSANTQMQIVSAFAFAVSNIQPYYYSTLTTPVINFTANPNQTLSFPTTQQITGLLPNNFSYCVSANIAYAMSVTSVGVINTIPTVNITMLSAGFTSMSATSAFTPALSAIIYATLFVPTVTYGPMMGSSYTPPTSVFNIYTSVNTSISSNASLATIPTIALTIPSVILFVNSVDLGFTALEGWQLLTSNAATGPTTQQPNDYNATQNPKVWFRIL